mgnify:CR=1 FL=1
MGSDSLGNKSRKALAWDLFGTVFRQMSLLIVTIILARLLDPEEFGIAGMSMVFISLTQVFIDVGFTAGIIQKKSISDIELSSVFYINLFISILLGVVIFLSAGMIGDFYDEPIVTSVVKYLAVIPAIAGLGKVHAAILVKKMSFKALTFRDILATVGGGIAGIIAALKGYGVYALVWQQIFTVFIGTILLWIGTGWFPAKSFSYSKIRSLLTFSSYVFFDQALRQIFLKVDTLFIGKVFSAATLGFYSRAESLNAQVSNYTSSSLRKVIFPVFSTLQDDSEKFREVYFKAFAIAAFTGTVSSGILFFLSKEIILGLLADKWYPSILIFQILVFRLLFMPFGPLIGKCMLAKGYSKTKFKVSQFQRFFMLAPLPVGYFYGIEAFTWALVGSTTIGFLISILMMHRLFHFSVADQLLIFVRPLVPMIVLIGVFAILDHAESGFINVSLFLLLQSVYSYIIKDKGAVLILQQVRILLSNLNFHPK